MTFTQADTTKGNECILYMKGCVPHATVNAQIPWHTLAYLGIPWHTLAYLGIPWHTLAYLNSAN